MASFGTFIKRIKSIEPHPNADAIEIAIVDGYRCIVRKGEFEAGELVAYISEASILPDELLKMLGFWDEEKQKGELSGSKGNTVRAIKLRGELSQGICMHALGDWEEGTDVSGILGITKMERNLINGI